MARDAATLDLLTDGRFELGLGAGHMRSEYDEVGLGFDPPGTRVERLVESVAILKTLLAGEEATHEGPHYRLHRHRSIPPGSRRVPIYVDGNGPRLLELAAREADIVGLVGFSHRRGGAVLDMSAFTATGTATRIELVRQAAGDRFAELELNALVQRAVVTDDPRARVGEIAAEMGLSVDETLTSPYLLLGSHESMAEQLEARRAQFALTYFVVPGSALEDFAPVVVRLY